MVIVANTNTKPRVDMAPRGPRNPIPVKEDKKETKEKVKPVEPVQNPVLHYKRMYFLEWCRETKTVWMWKDRNLVTPTNEYHQPFLNALLQGHQSRSSKRLISDCVEEVTKIKSGFVLAFVSQEDNERVFGVLDLECGRYREPIFWHENDVFMVNDVMKAANENRCSRMDYKFMFVLLSVAAATFTLLIWYGTQSMYVSTESEVFDSTTLPITWNLTNLCGSSRQYVDIPRTKNNTLALVISCMSNYPFVASEHEIDNNGWIESIQNSREHRANTATKFGLLVVTYDYFLTERSSVGHNDAALLTERSSVGHNDEMGHGTSGTLKYVYQMRNVPVRGHFLRSIQIPQNHRQSLQILWGELKVVG
jgi:hypothetical protein